MKKMSFIFLTIMILFVSIFVSGCSKKVNSGKYDYLVLVNKYSKLPDDWEKNVELVDAKNAWDEDVKIEKETYENYKKLKKSLEDEGITIELDSIYRSVKEQQELWDDWSNDPEKGIEYVKKYVAVPGYSEHHTGLAVDICLKKDGKLIDDNDDMIAEKEIFSKIHEKLADYGFILRYLDGRDDITGYAYEPWHLRYVGDKKIAKEIMDKDITFEEYLESVDDLENNREASKYQIEKTLQKEFKDSIYKDKISNSRFNVKKIYTQKDAKEYPEIDSLKIGKYDLAFDVEYEIMPVNEDDIIELTIPNGEYNEELGWITGISRVGILRRDSKDDPFKLDNFGTGW